MNRHLRLGLALTLAGTALHGAAVWSAPPSPPSDTEADAAKLLRTTLTPFGAERAGNTEGTIPPYTGGLRQSPPGYKPGQNFVSPYPNEKPLYSITQKNMAQFVDKLDAGSQELLKRYPDYHVDVYPTHRTVAYPDKVLDNSIKNLQRCQLAEDGLAVTGDGCHGGYPFPVPSNAYEIMWNHLVGQLAEATEGQIDSYFVDPAIGPLLSVAFFAHAEAPFMRDDFDPDKDPFITIRTTTLQPQRSAGEGLQYSDFLNPVKHPRQAFQYLPGQRRVKRAPNVGYDTPNDQTGGAIFYDDIELFQGKMDRFDFKLIGKKELFIPYNNYKLLYDAEPKEMYGKYFINPDLTRWELHRVWVIEATLKPDKRHLYSKRVFYFDEDAPGYGTSECYDGNGKLYRALYEGGTTWYDQLFPSNSSYWIYDFSANLYATINVNHNSSNGNSRVVKGWSKQQLSPSNMAGASVD